VTIELKSSLENVDPVLPFTCCTSITGYPICATGQSWHVSAAINSGYFLIRYLLICDLIVEDINRNQCQRGYLAIYDFLSFLLHPVCAFTSREFRSLNGKVDVRSATQWSSNVHQSTYAEGAHLF
jgi:hypothetical protein